MTQHLFTGRFRWAVPLVALLGGSAPVSLAAQVAPDTLRLADAIAAARADNPAHLAARLRADAAAEAIAPAGAMPDPELSLGLMNRPIDGFGSGEPMTMNQVGLAQLFPWPGKRAAAGDRARWMATSASLTADEIAADVAGRLAVQYYEAAWLDRAIAISTDTRRLLRELVRVAEARYAVGEVPQQDVFRSQVAVAQLGEQLEMLAAERDAAAARLNALMGRDPFLAVAALELPSLPSGPAQGDSAIVGAVADRPAIRAAEAMAEAATAGAREADRAFYPDLRLGVVYGQRPQYGDMATLMLGVQLPLHTGSRQAPQRDAMLAMAEAARADATDLRQATLAEIRAARAETLRARERVSLYDTGILPQARAAVDASLAAYRVGRVDFATVLDNELTLNRYTIDRARLVARHHQAMARIAALLGRTGGDA